MTLDKIRSLQNATLSTFAREVLQTASEWDLCIILHELSDNATIEEVDARLVEAWENFVDLGLITPAEDEDETEDLMDGDLEDQLENLLAEGDKEDAKLPRHCIDDLEKRYVLLTKIDGRYLTDTASDDLAEITRLKDIAYGSLSDLIHREGQGVAAITIFDRDADMDLYHVELCLYRPREASRLEQAMEGVR